MNSGIWLSTFCALILTGCSSTHPRFADDPLGTGPFDSRGNYREDWVDDPSKWTKPGRRQQGDDLPFIAKNEEPPPNATPLASRRVPTSKPAAARPKPKPKPKSTRYTVKRGDTLSGIASRYRSSVAGIRRANGISGSLIRPGQSLVVPRR